VERALKIAPHYKHATQRQEELRSGTDQISLIGSYYPLETSQKKASATIGIISKLVIGVIAAAVMFFLMQSAVSAKGIQNSFIFSQTAESTTQSLLDTKAETALPTLTPTPGSMGKNELGRKSGEVVQLVVYASLEDGDGNDVTIPRTGISEGWSREDLAAFGAGSTTHADEEVITTVVQATATATASFEVIFLDDGASEGVDEDNDNASTIPETAEEETTDDNIPALDRIINKLKNGIPSQVVGIFVEDTLVLRAVQQPTSNPGYVGSVSGTVTYFAMVKQTTGNDGLLAHNYLSGSEFFYLRLGQRIFLIYGDGNYREFDVSEIKQYQATSPLSPYSNFIDLITGDTLDSTTLFYTVYDGYLRLTLQTCIERDGEWSWGRYFIIAHEN